MKTQTGNRSEHWSKKTNIVQRENEAGKILVETDIVQIYELTMAHKDGDGWVQLSERKTMIDQALMKSEKREGSQTV